MLIGYCSTLGCRAGESVDVMISGSGPSATVDLVRVIHGDTNPLGPGLVLEDIAEVAPVDVQTREVATPIGSYALSRAAVTLAGTLSLSLAFWPTTPGDGRLQTLLALPGVAIDLSLDGAGRLVLRGGGTVLAQGSAAVRSRVWYRADVELGADAAVVTLSELSHAGGRVVERDRASGPGYPVDGDTVVLFAASALRQEGSQRFAEGLYNGKIATPRLGGGSVDARWAFEQEMATQTVPDPSGGLHLDLVNVPTRAMTGPTWDGSVHAFTRDPSQYDAIHFHDDDLSDACWPVSATISLPESLPSGVYAVRLRAPGEADDLVPLSVRPARSAKAAKVAVVLSTFTYVAYANEHLTEGDFEQPSEIKVKTGEWEALAATHQEWGRSVYDHHADGSGVAHSTYLRPIPNLRPSYRFWGFDAPRRFSCDLYIVHFLHRLGIPFDIMTEHDLDLEAETILAPYQTVIAGSHPEYTSGAMLDAFESHVEAGGGLLYLGGDGFYWVTTLMPDVPAVIEVRKSEGLRHWDAEPGERYHAGTGELGGLWRTRGRSAHKLFGVGMHGHGWDRKAPGYRRTPESYRPDVAWVFDGIGDEVVGDFGLIMNGTSGDEIDRVDPRFGTPPETVVLASSEPHSEWYVPVVEDVTTVSNYLNATYNRGVRSDMVLIERDGGGAVFSVGSIIFAGALPMNGGDNNIARLLENVVRNFTARG